MTYDSTIAVSDHYPICEFLEQQGYGLKMHKNNKALFIFGLVFYFIGDLATTYLALSNRLSESGLVRIITIYDFSIMVLMKVIFFTALYFFIEYLEKRDNHLCRYL